jgi:hypothetical protein
MKSEKEIKDKITAIINTQIQAMADDKTHIVGNLQGCVRALQWVLDIDDDCSVYESYASKQN